jgi:hypothetical protein
LITRLFDFALAFDVGARLKPRPAGLKTRSYIYCFSPPNFVVRPFRVVRFFIDSCSLLPAFARTSFARTSFAGVTATRD